MLDWEERGLRTAAPDVHGTFLPILFNSHYWALITSSILGHRIPNGPHFVSQVENFLTIPKMNSRQIPFEKICLRVYQAYPAP